MEHEFRLLGGQGVRSQLPFPLPTVKRVLCLSGQFRLLLLTPPAPEHSAGYTVAGVFLSLSGL